jgi:hypothetical protein
MASKNKQVQKFCRIFQWVEREDADFAGAIRDLCMERALSAGRRGGVTFLYPGADARKKIVDEAYGKAPESAIDLLNAHVITTAVATASEFLKKGKELELATRGDYALEVESTSGDDVKLKGGAVLKPAKSFAPLKSRDNIAVWLVASGAVPTSGPKPKAGARGGRSGGVRGGDESDAPAPSHTGARARRAVAQTVEKQFADCQGGREANAALGSNVDPYLAHAVSLLNFLDRQHPEVFAAVLPLVDRCAATTFYLLLEPYKAQGGDYMIADDVLFGAEGWNGAMVFQEAVGEYEQVFARLAQQNTPCAQDRGKVRDGQPELVVPWIYRDPVFVRSAVDDVRCKKIVGDAGQKLDKATPQCVHKAYEALVATNTIGSAYPVFPDATLALLGSGAKKLWQDELRWILAPVFADLKHGPGGFSAGTFAETVQLLSVDRPGDNYRAEASVSNPEAIRASVDAEHEIDLLGCFANSTDFLYHAVPKTLTGGADWGSIPATPTPVDLQDHSAVQNTEAAKQNVLDLDRAQGGNERRSVTGGAIAELEHYMKSNGGALPPRLAALASGRSAALGEAAM